MNKLQQSSYAQDINILSTWVPSFNLVLGTLLMMTMCIYLYYIWEREMEKWGKKKANKNLSILQYTWPLSRCIQNLKTLALIGAEKSVTESVTENSIGEEEKWTNKGKDNQEEADSLLHNTTRYYMFVLNFKILGTVVPEKSLMQISLCITLERDMEKRENGKRR